MEKRTQPPSQHNLEMQEPYHFGHMIHVMTVGCKVPIVECWIWGDSAHIFYAELTAGPGERKTVYYFLGIEPNTFSFAVPCAYHLARTTQHTRRSLDNFSNRNFLCLIVSRSVVLASRFCHVSKRHRAFLSHGEHVAPPPILCIARGNQSSSRKKSA